MPAFSPRSLIAALLLAASVNAWAQLTVVTSGDAAACTRGSIVSYPEILAEELLGDGIPVRMVNAALATHTTVTARARFEADVLAVKPDVAIVQFGINDSIVDVWRVPPATKPHVHLGEYEKNLRAMVASLRQSGARVILLTPNPLRWTAPLKTRYGSAPYLPDDPEGFNVTLRDYVATVQRIAREEGTGLVDIYAQFLHHARKPGHSLDDLMADGLRPNVRGQRLIADLVADHLATHDRRFVRRVSSP